MPTVKIGPKHQVTIPKDVFEAEWQTKEREADEAIAKGEVSGPFSKASDALKALKKKPSTAC